jgi:hypothetical protein
MNNTESMEKYKTLVSLREQLKNCKDDAKAIELQAKLVEILLDAVQDDKFKEFLAVQSLLKKGP